MVKTRKIFLSFFIFIIFSCASKEINPYEGSHDNFNKALSYFNDEKFVRAKDEFNLLIYNAPLSPFLSESQFYIAECTYNLGEYSHAISEYDKYLNMADQNISLVQKAELMKCRCFYNLSLGYSKDQSGTKQALEYLQDYIEKEIVEENILEIESMIKDLRVKSAKKDFETAKLYIRLEEYDAATIYFKNVLNEYYDTNYFDYSAINLSILEFINGRDKAIGLLESNKNNFIKEQEYFDALDLLNTLTENEDIGYYIKQMK